jgi:hypothetical protein
LLLRNGRKNLIANSQPESNCFLLKVENKELDHVSDSSSEDEEPILSTAEDDRAD